MSLLKELEAHTERIAAANRRAREVDLKVRAAARKVEEVNNELIEAHASDDAAQVGKLEKALAVAEIAAKRLKEQKFVGAQRAAQRAEADRLAFVAQNYAALIDEFEPKAREVAQEVENALADLEQAHGAWQAVEAEVMALMRHAGRGHERTPEFPAGVAQVVRDIGRLGGANVPAPLPRITRPTDTDDPERAAYERARRAEAHAAPINDRRAA